ncbi:putative sporulation protein YtxC [Paenibacillus protaetiae]|uniref:Sporulation protein n=1 Tax=Paenibacillus protaetiae TaxID=2509456 RepID=A0A4P6F295_9BACL|nr:putative sporulation protein YtxC [Paenibacillus protaetiae]QAY68259.1 sporulation protein [Paenibacillus protaetiae]
MELFTITLHSGAEGAIVALQGLLAQYAAKDLHKFPEANEQLVHFELIDKHRVRCTAVLPQFRLADHSAALYRSASQALAEYVVHYMESDLLTNTIRRKYRNHESDMAVIIPYCHQLLYGSDADGLGVKFQEADKRRRKNKVAEEIEPYLQEYTDLNLNGFALFRLRAYRNELEEIVEYALDEYVLDKQYQEFISLLKYFVCLQETKVPEVHLVHKGGHEFELLNERFQALEPKPHTDRVVAEMLEAEINIEDMVISSLIAVSPKVITIHTRQPDAQVIRTIETIFDSRVQICAGCVSCSQRLDEMDHVQP